MDLQFNHNRGGNTGSARSAAYLTPWQIIQARYLPGRLTAPQAAVLLGVEENHIPILVKARLLKPLGNPPRNAPKFFARDYIIALAADETWLAKASDALVSHWAKRNAKKP